MRAWRGRVGVMGRTWRVCALFLLGGACAKSSCGPLYPCKADSDCPRANWYCSPSLNACADRDAGVAIVQPASGGYVGKSASVVATIGAEVGGPLNPSSLTLTAQPDGGPAETATLLPADGGNFVGSWSPSRPGLYVLTATWTDPGIVSPPVQVTAVLSPPSFALQIPNPPARPGALYQDPNLPNAWRRDEIVPVSVTSPDPIVDNTTVQVLVLGIDGGPLPSRFAV